jgi:hypothetical protein
MSVLAATTVAALLIASPGPADSTADVAGLAAKGGFLLGNAQRCGIASDRVTRTGQLIRDLIAAEAADAQEQDEATKLFARFFIVHALTDSTAKKPVASCALVTSEFEELERHQPAGEGYGSSGRDKPGSSPRPGNGE